MRSTEPRATRRTWRVGFQTSNNLRSVPLPIPCRHVDKQIGHVPVLDGAKELDVLGVSPHQWHG